MSSLGGRCPKKLYIFLDLVKNDPEEGDGEGGTTSAPGIGTPKPERIDTVDARFIFLVPAIREGVFSISPDGCDCGGT